MKDEVNSAVGFLTNILRSSDGLNEAQVRQFGLALSNLLCKRYHEHWFPEKPFKGSGYRCIRLNHNMDPIILQAGQVCGLNQAFLETVLPQELTLWVDPREVSFRIGENGSVGILYSNEEQQVDTQSESQLISAEDIHQAHSKSVTSFKSCKDQFMNVLPSMAQNSLNYQQLAGFISS